ncbi:MAG: carboxypeptidase-like regulatory domain-containing protein [Chloroflexota bacterium]|nr:MAG: hypothetical protein DLM70_01585 [Chloroflexota bacterium]
MRSHRGIEQAPSAAQRNLTGKTKVSGATISWFGPVNGSLYTDISGNYSVAGLPAGTYRVDASYGGCTPATAAVRIVAGTSVTQNFHLTCP